MKKIFSILIIVLCLVSCSENENIKTQEEDKDIKIWTDTETNVQYVIYCSEASYAGMGGITPRLNADGTLYITEKGGVE